MGGGEGRGGEGGLPIILPIIAYYGEASPERGTFFRLQVNKGGGGGGGGREFCSLKSFGSVNGPKGLTDEF